MIGTVQRALATTHSVLVHTPSPGSTGAWESHLWEVVRIPKVGEHVVHAGDLFRVELVIHPLYEHTGAQSSAEYTAELCCVPVDKQAVLRALTDRAIP